jgi:hypothetical protein
LPPRRALPAKKAARESIPALEGPDRPTPPSRVGDVGCDAIRGRPAARRLCPKSLQELVGSGPQGDGHRNRALAHDY